MHHRIHDKINNYSSIIAPLKTILSVIVKMQEIICSKIRKFVLENY